MKILLLLSVCIYPNFTFSQSINDNDLDFLIYKIKHTYVGYNEKMHEKDLDKIYRGIKLSKSVDTFSQLSKLTLYFNDCHLTLFESVKLKLKNIDTNECTKNLNLLNLENFKAPQSKLYEGYYLNEENSVIIFLKRINKKLFKGYVIESKSNFKEGFCTILLKKYSKNNFIGDFVDINRNYRVITKSFFKNSDVLLLGSHSRWSKIKNYSKNMLLTKTVTDFSPFISVIDSTTLLFNVKDFGSANHKQYDSVVKSNASKLEEANTLIIDARNNSGGGYGRIRPLLPYICTKSILLCDTYTLYSEDLIENTTSELNKYIKLNDTLNIKSYKSYLDTLIANKNSLYFNKGDTIKVNPKKTSIKNVAILYSATSRSAAELMIMYLKQSDKVKTFGERSGGVVDNLGMLTYRTPSQKNILWIAFVKRVPTKENPLYDDTGIPPDVEISDDEPDWINYVLRYYSK
jgi:hypothetical protein